MSKCLLSLLLSLPLAACSSNPGPRHTTALAPPAAAAQDYQIQPGDSLDIRFFYNPELNEQQLVRPDGRITLQLIGEEVVAGRTPHELETTLRNEYSHELKQPEIAVIIRGFGGQKAYVDGEVGRPGMVDLQGGLSALQALAQSGGAKATADLDDAILIRRVDGKPVAVPLNLEGARDGKDLGQDIQLRPFDVLYVPKSTIANVNTFIDQYFRQNVPIPFGAGYTF